MAKRRTEDAENEVIEVPVDEQATDHSQPDPPTTTEVRKIRLVGGAYAGDHLSWPEGTEHYDNNTHACPHATGTWIYGAADPLMKADGYDTYVLHRAERAYGGQ